MGQALCRVCASAKAGLSRRHFRETCVTGDTVSFGYEDVAPAEKTRRVGEVFASVARRYDIMNDLMSAGAHRLWKDDFVRQINPREGEDVLDMAGGTGDIAFRMAARGANVTVADINPDMLQVGIDRAAARGLTSLVWREQNAETLSFPDRSYDAYSIAFGIRNVTDIPAALREAHRVLRFGGRFFCLEFSTTTWPGFGEVYDLYSEKLVPRIGEFVAKDGASYKYLIESIRRFPPMPEFARMIEAAGFARVKYRPILGGAVAIHSGWKI
ncbi:ubiquinone/menaquinone biosynthesis C-methyltransferase UbiE [Polymorphobacter multimanifer]|nr:ubiquinone/menaquinone biosynthesis C-methyltransferase UbiE [Polymorphobacter multimanifer]